MDCNDILLSIIVPVYNVESYLSRCLDSLLSIKGLTFEIILVNDGSTDNSLQICLEYKDKHPCIKLINQHNKGQSAARNVGLSMAYGKYIAFVDSDDYINQNTIESAIKYLESNTWCDMIQFPVLEEAGSNKEKKVIAGRGELRDRASLISSFALEESLSWRIWDKLYRREVLQGIDFREGIVYEDNLYMCEVLLNAHTAYLSDIGCYNYCYNPTSTTHSPSPQSFIDMCTVHGEMYNLIAENSSDYTIRTHMIYRVVNDMYASYRFQGINHPCIRVGIPYMKRSRVWDILRANDITLSRKIKILLVKLLSHIL